MRDVVSHHGAMHFRRSNLVSSHCPFVRRTSSGLPSSQLVLLWLLRPRSQRTRPERQAPAVRACGPSARSPGKSRFCTIRLCTTLRLKVNKEQDVCKMLSTLTSAPDYFITTVSLAIVAVRNWKKMISILAPYLMLLACFAGFVIWNGGVVLGEPPSTIPYVIQLTKVRRQIQPRRHHPSTTDALPLALHALLLLAHNHPVFPPRQHHSLQHLVASTTKSAAPRYNDKFGHGNCTLQYHHPSLHAGR
jgi:hypothetical protein